MKKNDIELNKYFESYSNNMAIILDYIRYKKDLHNYYQDGYKIYKMIPYIQYSVDTTLAIKLFGFFDTKNNTLPFKNFLDIVKNSPIYAEDKCVEISRLEIELKSFLQSNVTMKSITRIRHTMTHVNPKDNPENLTVEEVEALVEWIKNFINELHQLCGKSVFGYVYESTSPPIFADVLDILKNKKCKATSSTR